MVKDKISFLSAIFLSISSIIGGGIFIKTKILNELSQNRTLPLIFLFLISFVGIICFTYALIKIIPIQTTNAGFIEWTQKLCPSWFNKISINFVRNVYHPVSLLLFSAYVIQNFFGKIELNLWNIIIFAFLICIIFMTINLISFRISKTLQIILLFLVLIPLILLPILGFLSTKISTISNNENVLPTSPSPPSSPSSNLDAWFVLGTGLPSILFIFDGFYSFGSLKEKFKKPNYLSHCLIISFAIVTLLYLYVIIGFNLGDPISGSYENFEIIRSNKNSLDVFKILIGCASLLTLNSIILGNVYQLSAINKIYEFKDIKMIERFLFYKKDPNIDKNFQSYFISWIYLLFKTFIWFLIIGLIAQISMWIGKKNIWKELLDSWTDNISVLIFTIIVGVILQGIIKEKKWNSQNYKFKIAGWIAYIFIMMAIVCMCFCNIFSMIVLENKTLHIARFCSLIGFLIISGGGQIWSKIKVSLDKKRLMILSNEMKDSILTLE